MVWLNETQLYLDTPGDTGERVAAALQTVLSDPGRGPVLVLGTLWSAHRDALTREDTGHPQARKILDSAATIEVPAAFTGRELQDLGRAAAGDVRLAEAAAPAYMTDAEWDDAGEDWLEQALAYTAAPCKGVHGPITRIRARPIPPAVPAGRHGVSRQEAGQAHPWGPVYRLADDLDQHGRRQRASLFPPDGFWGAALAHAQPADQAAIAVAARSRGLYRHAAQLLKTAAVRGHPGAASSLITLLHQIHPTDLRPADWAAAHVSLGDPVGVVTLLGSLREANAGQQAVELSKHAARPCSSKPQVA